MAVAKFWKYFVKKEKALRDQSVSTQLISEFERHLFAVVETDWEIGPADETRTRLSLSPSPSDGDQVKMVKKLLDAAPNLADWEFALYKPPRQWNLEFSIIAKEVKQSIDATKWEFVLFSFEDGTFDIVFRPDKAARRIDQQALEHAATVIVDGELGERFDGRKLAISRSLPSGHLN